jgi:hypothetical protein
MKNTVSVFMLFFSILLTEIAPADASEQQKIDSEKDNHQVYGRSSKEDFLEQLENGKSLSLFFSDHWVFVYHRDSRCDGSTDGKVVKLAKAEIDKTIKIRVKNDGDGWLKDYCNKKENRRTFYLNFSLKKQVADWDRFEISDTGNQTENVIYIHGRGESDYLVLHYGKNNLIIKMEYRSEDPG